MNQHELAAFRIEDFCCIFLAHNGHLLAVEFLLNAGVALDTRTRYGIDLRPIC